MKSFGALLAVVVIFWGSLARGQGCGPFDSPMNQNNGQDGIMINITAITDVFIDSVWTNFDAGTIPLIEIYYKAGTFVGFQGNAGAWTLAGSATNVVSAGVNNHTHIPIYLNLQVLAGQTMALYITSGTTGPGMDYTNGPGGSTGGQLYNSTPEIDISYGNGLDYPFGMTFDPRIFNGKIFYSCCPPPPPIQGPVTGPSIVCQGDTVQYEVPWDSLAVSYEWVVGPDDSIVSGQGDSLITVAIGANSMGGSVCVAYEDTCTFTDTICYTYTINQPPVPVTPVGIDTICSQDSAWYFIPPQATAVSYTWTVDNGAVVASNLDSTAVLVVFNNGGATSVCASYYDGCALSPPACLPVVVNDFPTSANAGPDQTICSNNNITMAATPLSFGSGMWSVISAPTGGAGNFTNATSESSSYFGFGSGTHVLRWTVGNAPCPSTYDEVTITVDDAPIADFNVSDVCDGEQVSFMDQSQGNGTTISTWQWDVTGDGTTDYTVQNPVHTYGSTGTTTTTLIVSSAACADTASKTVTVYPVPVADFTYNPACEDAAMSLADNTFISGGTLAAWEWEFGDNTSPDTAQNPVHVFDNDGWYVVTLTATTTMGCSDSYADSVEAFANPVVDFIAPDQCQHDTFFFESVYASTNGDVVYWLWDFGDGSAQITDTNAPHKFDIPETYNVNLSVATNKGCTSSVVKPVAVYPVPVPDFSLQGECERQPVNFIDETQMDTLFGSKVVAWDWSFGNGQVGIKQNPLVYFGDDGEFPVTLIPYSNHGCYDTLVKKVIIRPKPEANIVVLDDEVCAGTPVHFRDESFFDFTYDSIGVVEWKWDFGNGKTSSVQHPVNVFSEGGEYPVRLLATSFYGCFDSAKVEAVIHHNPVAKFNIANREGCAPFCPVFMDSSYVADEGVLTYRWNFGDGSASGLQFPDHCYDLASFPEDEKAFTVGLKVETEFGCADSSTFPEPVYVYPVPVAGFDISESRVSMIDPVVFITNTSSGADFFHWDFGDNTDNEFAEPGRHIYESPGIYEVSLLASTDRGCTDALSKSIAVEPHQTVFVPNAFTPNKDILNDYWQPYGEDLEYVKIQIFDRWGRVVYEGQDENAKWDGNLDGAPAPIGVYGYFIEYRHTGGANQKLEGNFVLTKRRD